MPHSLLLCLALFSLVSCNSQPAESTTIVIRPQKTSRDTATLPYNSEFKTIHVFVALCDNKYQGIVPVPARIGNGQDPDNNLYWGCSAGIRTWFKNSKEWKFIKKYKLDKTRPERLIFIHVSKNFYLVADAYDGQFIKQCTHDFLKSCSGQSKDTIRIQNTIIGINGNAKLLSYIGHDGLMDFSLPGQYQQADNEKREAIILACISKSYFGPLLKQTNAYPLVWTTGLMCPEAYTLHDALRSYTDNESKENIRTSAAKAYATHQRCSEKAARNLLVSGW